MASLARCTSHLRRIRGLSGASTTRSGTLRSTTSYGPSRETSCSRTPLASPWRSLGAPCRRTLGCCGLCCRAAPLLMLATWPLQVHLGALPQGRQHPGRQLDVSRQLLPRALEFAERVPKVGRDVRAFSLNHRKTYFSLIITSQRYSSRSLAGRVCDDCFIPILSPPVN